MFGAIGITFERLSSAKVESLRSRLAMRPLACAERRRSVVEQTCDVEDFLLRSAHDSYPIQQIAALRTKIVHRSEILKQISTTSLNRHRRTVKDYQNRFAFSTILLQAYGSTLIQLIY